MTVDDDVVVLVDGLGNQLGTAPRTTFHTHETPLHLAFSVYMRDQRGRVLMTRRALDKVTWAGVWTNAACGHQRPGEGPMKAAMRRVPDEIGAVPLNLRLALPDFRYRAVDASGIVENELCPVMVAEVDASQLVFDPTEVAEHGWAEWADLRATAATMPHLLSPWSVKQINELGDDPWAQHPAP
ncbi:MAG: isopentenyl-diphosphate Delta-isomerase [Arachnia sp.]